jgi:hypothetical protein
MHVDLVTLMRKQDDEIKADPSLAPFRYIQAVHCIGPDKIVAICFYPLYMELILEANYIYVDFTFSSFQGKLKEWPVVGFKHTHCESCTFFSARVSDQTNGLYRQDGHSLEFSALQALQSMTTSKSGASSSLRSRSGNVLPSRTQSPNPQP